MNPTEPPQVLVGEGLGFAVRRVMPAVRQTEECSFEGVLVQGVQASI